jgi:hypothetical protein
VAGEKQEIEINTKKMGKDYIDDMPVYLSLLPTRKIGE